MFCQVVQAPEGTEELVEGSFFVECYSRQPGGGFQKVGKVAQIIPSLDNYTWTVVDAPVPGRRGTYYFD